MKIGSYEIFALETGEFALDGGAMFGVVPKTLWGKRIGVDDKNRIDMRLRCLLLIGDGRRILIDCGMGRKWNEKMSDIYRLDYSKLSLEKSLAAHQLSPEKITDVVLTHLHFDHAGGSTQYSGESKSGGGGNPRLEPTFPNATYYIQKENLEWAQNPKEKDRASYIKEDWEPLQAAGVLKIINKEGEILPGIDVRRFYGHTHGIQLPLINDGKTKLFFCGDVIPTSVHLGIPWVMAYDNFPLTTIEEKKKILQRAAKENWILVFEHCPHVGAARVTATEKGCEITEKITL